MIAKTKSPNDQPSTKREVIRGDLAREFTGANAPTDVPVTNAAGVYTRGVKTLHVTLPKTLKTRAQINYVMVSPGRWRSAIAIEGPGYGNSGPITETSEVFQSFAVMLERGVNELAKRARSSYSNKPLNEKAAKAILAWHEEVKAKYADPVPPGETGTTTPAGIVKHDPDVVRSTKVQTLKATADALGEASKQLKAKPAPATEPTSLGPIFRVPIEDVTPNPDNIERTEDDILSMMQLLLADGQREPIVLRKITELRKFSWRIISGHRRYFAARRIGWTHLEARERIGCHDELTELRDLAAYNGQRNDPNPIAKAKLIVKLCAKGATRAQAAIDVGLESPGAASNLVRLLELPEWWLAQIAAGKVSQVHAREVLPYVASPALMSELQKAVKDAGNVKEWAEDVYHIVQGNARPMTGQYYDGGYKTVAFKPTPEQREQLQIVTLKDSGGNKREAALNVKLWEELQAPALKAAKKEERQAATPKKATAKESKEAEAKREQQFARELYAWKIDWLKYLVARDLTTLENESLTTPATLRVLLWIAADGVCAQSELGDVLGKRIPYDEIWKALAKVANNELEETVLKFVAALLFTKQEGPNETFPADVVEGLARLLQTNLVEAWKAELAGPLTEAYLELHSREQLVALAIELQLGMELMARVPSGMDYQVKASKAELVEAIPKCAGAKKKLPAEIKAAKEAK